MLGSHRLEHILDGGGSHDHERLAQPLPLSRGKRQCPLKDVVGDDACFDEKLAQTEWLRRGGAHGGRIIIVGPKGRQLSL
ncbi:MAG TPA: hypothetical protein VJ971_04425 [Methylomirabilota bacterium]|nr:hypothetical protein [Methylomirabilota bacterium]